MQSLGLDSGNDLCKRGLREEMLVHMEELKLCFVTHAPSDLLYTKKKELNGVQERGPASAVRARMGILRSRLVDTVMKMQYFGGKTVVITHLKDSRGKDK